MFLMQYEFGQKNWLPIWDQVNFTGNLYWTNNQFSEVQTQQAQYMHLKNSVKQANMIILQICDTAHSNQNCLQQIM